MHKALSAEHLADFAHQAVTSLKRLMSSSNFLDPHAALTPSQQDLLSTSKQIEDLDKRLASVSHNAQGSSRNSVVDVTVVEMWARSLSDELDCLAALPTGTTPSVQTPSTMDATIPSSPKVSNTAVFAGLPLPPASAAAASNANGRRSLNEAQLIQCIDCTRTVVRVFGSQLSEVFLSTQLVSRMLLVFRCCQWLPKKVSDALQLAIQDSLGGELGALHKDAHGALVSLIRVVAVSAPPASGSSSIASTPISQDVAPDDGGRYSAAHIKNLQLFVAILRRTQLQTLVGSTAPGTVLDDAEREECLTLLLHQLRELRRLFLASPSGSRHARITTAATLTLIAVHTLCQGHPPSKAWFLQQPDAKDLWVFVGNHVHKMECVMSHTVTLPNGKSEERVVSLDQATVAAWAGDIAEMLIELCTTDGFCLRRQSLHAAEAAWTAPPTPPSASGSGSVSGSSAMVGQGGKAGHSRSLLRWEPLPAAWDVTLTSGATVVWRLAAALVNCRLQRDAVRHLFSFAASLETHSSAVSGLTSNAMAEYIFRCVMSSVLLLCNASPANTAILAEGHAFHMVVELLSAVELTVFPIRGDLSLRRCGSSPLMTVPTPPAAALDDARSEGGSFEICSTPPSVGPSHGGTPLRVGEACRQLLFSLLSVVVSQQLQAQDVSLMMCAIESMRGRETTLEDCQIIEHILHTVGATTFSSGAMFFGGGNSAAVSHVDKFVGRWYGYTLLAWVHPLCVWGEGNAVFSFAEASTPSAVVVCIVANGKSRSLVVRTTSGKEFSIALLPDTALSTDGWTHLAFVHNMSGFAVYINGKRATTHTSLPYPKEPTKPQKLMFGFGCDCSDRCDANSIAPNNSSTRAGTTFSPRSVLPFFGFTCGFDLVDGAVGDKEIERIAAAGPQPLNCTSGETREVLLSLSTSPVATDEGVPMAEMSGLLLPKRTSSNSAVTELYNITVQPVPHVPSTLASLGFVSWATDVILKAAADGVRNHDATEAIIGGSSTETQQHQQPQQQQLTMAVSTTNSFIKSNRNIIAVLCLECMSTAFKLASKEELDKYHELGVIGEVQKAFLNWPSGGIPPEFANSLVSIAIPQGGGKLLRHHPTTASILDAVVDILNCAQAMPSFFAATLKDLSELLSAPQNAKVFREKPTRFTALLLASTTRMPSESISDFVALLEKLCKESYELEQLLRFVAFAFDDVRSTSASTTRASSTATAGTRHVEFVICEVLRMLYDVGRPNAAMCELIANSCGGSGVWWLLYMIQAHRHGSEAIRICATKLLALVLHSSKRARELFVKANGFELLAIAIAPPPPTTADGNPSPQKQAPSVRLMTYNCLYKFALDFYTPNNVHAHSGSVVGHRTLPPPAAAAVQNAIPATGTTGFGFHGHMPGVLPARTNRRGLSVDLGYGGECVDVEGRLSVDDIYSEQAGGGSKDVLVYPQGIQVVLQLLGLSVRHLIDAEAAYLETDLTPQLSSVETALAESSDLHLGGDRSQASNTNSLVADQAELVVRVLSFLDRIVDVTPNAVALAAQPWWLESVWAAVEPLLGERMTPSPQPVAGVAKAHWPSDASAPHAPGFTDADTASSIVGRSHISTGSSALRLQLRADVEAVVRSILRKVAVVDLTRQSKALTVRRVKEVVDVPQLQRIVVEEIVRHFSEHNRMDTMDPTEANNCIRNLDSLMQGVDDCVVPFPNPLAVEIVFAIRAIVVNNNTWVRLKMKNSTKLFEVRDRLAFSLMTSIKEFSKEHVSFLPQLIEVNLQDGNTLIVILRNLVDAVSQRNLEEVETLQSMLRMLYSADDDQRKAMQKLLETDAVELLQQRNSQRTTPSSASGSASSATASEPISQDFISWCMQNEARWDAMVQKITKAYRPVEAEVRAVTEKRDKERSARIKARKVELEKRAATTQKGLQEVERLRLDIETKGLQSFREACSEAKQLLSGSMEQ